MNEWRLLIRFFNLKLPIFVPLITLIKYKYQCHQTNVGKIQHLNNKTLISVGSWCVLFFCVLWCLEESSITNGLPLNIHLHMDFLIVNHEMVNSDVTLKEIWWNMIDKYDELLINNHSIIEEHNKKKEYEYLFGNSKVIYK